VTTRLMRWMLTGLLLGAGLPGAIWAGADAATASGYTLHQDVFIPMSDGMLISANVFLPDKGCPCPTILNQTPYRKATTPNGFVQHGYAEVITDVRGTGSSQGYWEVFSAREQKDGAEIVNWIAHQKWSNHKVGLWGPSYMAINQFMTVEQPGVSAVKAIFPIVPMSDSYRDVTWSSGAWDSSFMSWWYALTTSESIEDPDYTTSQPQIALNTESQHLLDVYGYQAPDLAGEMLGAYQHALCEASGGTAFTCNYNDSAYDGADYRLRSPIDRIANVHVPTFIVGGSWDIFQRGEPLIYKALHLPTTEKKLLIGPWYHVAASAAAPPGLPAKDITGRTVPSTLPLAVSWFDHWLKGKRNGIQNFPNVETYVQGLNKWAPSTSFPIAGTKDENLYLSPDASGSGAHSLDDGSLTGKLPRVGSNVMLPWLPANDACSRNTFQWTAGLAGEASNSPTTCETTNGQNELQSLTFTTPAMKNNFTISGPMNLHLYVSSMAADTSLSAVVTDVAPDGTSDVITGGSLVGSLRDVTSKACGARTEYCSVYSGGQIIEPWHPYTYDSLKAMEPNVVYDMQLEIFPTTAQIRKGHRLRVVVMSGDSPHRLDTASTLTGEASGGGADWLWFGPAYPARLYLGHAPLG
jgi:uncharacterized protein